MKFALFIVCALMVIQGLQITRAQSSEPSDHPLTDIFSDIKTLLEKYKIILYVFGHHIPELLQDLVETVTREQIPQQVISLRQKVQQLVMEGRHCFEDNRFNVDGLYQCLVKEMQPNGEAPALEELQEKAIEVIAVAKELVVNVSQALNMKEEMAPEIDAKYTAI